MIRYDPTEKEHFEYEVKLISQSQTKEKNIKKKKHEKAKVGEPAPVKISKDIYYNVSDTLTESLKHNEGFSLLKVFGREKNSTSIYIPKLNIFLFLLRYFDNFFNNIFFCIFKCRRLQRSKWWY